MASTSSHDGKSIADAVVPSAITLSPSSDMVVPLATTVSPSTHVVAPSTTTLPPSVKEEIIKKRIGKTVAVEGNIGSGKTTFLNYFQKYKNVEVLAEPVAKWRNVMGYNALDLLYTDTERWSCAFEFLVTLSLLENHQALQDHAGLKMMERSIYSTRHCFMEHLIKNGQIQALDQLILSEWHEWVDQHEDISLDLIVYLRASPEVCADRMKLRNRSEEADIPMDYLRALHQLHDDWLLHDKRGQLPAHVLVLDADKDLVELQKEIDNLTQDIFCGLDIR
uniref:Deoxynucleoside kinase domain-containing protein n=1 Tax=Arion vulgaris TaxID=1028688 RepID=A0A0B6ZPP8_9EUPU